MRLRAPQLWWVLILWAALARGDQAEIDREIVKDFDFFYHMETLENDAVMDADEGSEDGEKGEWNEDE